MREERERGERKFDDAKRVSAAETLLILFYLAQECVCHSRDKSEQGESLQLPQTVFFLTFSFPLPPPPAVHLSTSTAEGPLDTELPRRPRSRRRRHVSRQQVLLLHLHRDWMQVSCKCSEKSITQRMST